MSKHRIAVRMLLKAGRAPQFTSYNRKSLKILEESLSPTLTRQLEDSDKNPDTRSKQKRKR